MYPQRHPTTCNTVHQAPVRVYHNIVVSNKSISKEAQRCLHCTSPLTTKTFYSSLSLLASLCVESWVYMGFLAQIDLKQE